MRTVAAAVDNRFICRLLYDQSKAFNVLSQVINTDITVNQAGAHSAGDARGRVTEIAVFC
jgi:hypothetical protein